MNEQRDQSSGSLLQLSLGATIGPFVGNMSNVLAPLLVIAFAIEKSQLSQAVIAHSLPFAILQVFSGTISDRFGRRRTLLFGFMLFTVSSALGALAPTWDVFLVGRALQGIANAFTTALILATIGDTTPQARLGRAIGVFTAINTLGQLAAPLIGGALGDVGWRVPYVVLAVYSAALTASCWLWFRRYGEHVAEGRQGTVIRNMRGLMNGRMALLVGVSYLVSLGLMGPVYLYAIYVKDTWQFSTTLIGWVLAAYGISGIIATRWAGRLADRIGPLGCAGIGIALGFAGFALMSLTGSAALWTVGYAFVGSGGGAIYTAINTLPVRTFPTMRGGASSLFQSGKFFAPVTAPLIFNPIYFALSPRAIFPIQAIGLALVLIPLWAISRSNERRRVADIHTAPAPAD